MFPIGSANMFERTRKLMAQIAQVIAATKNKVAISGHTDSMKFKGKRAGRWRPYGKAHRPGGRQGRNGAASGIGSQPPYKDRAAAGKRPPQPLCPGQGPIGEKADFRQNWSGPRLR